MPCAALTGSIRDSIYHMVVVHDDLLVPREMHVDFKQVDPKSVTVRERRQRVLAALLRPTAVRARLHTQLRTRRVDESTQRTAEKHVGDERVERRGGDVRQPGRHEAE